ncbi:MAG TPA: hypothetical protein VFZ22_02950 [Pyrinomonadaceae bacterium]|nr:hypothetical protein [Pyrinomonadaceae bacterium]
MSENRTIQLAAIPIGGKGGFVWNRLHGEREDICEALLKFSEPSFKPLQNEKLLQARLRRIDDALDRLMSGAYGICSKCGRTIEDTTLDVDPAWALCLDCWGRESHETHLTRDEHHLTDGDPRTEIMLENLEPFDTILLRTHNNDYRMLLLDPKTGRALVEGGSLLTEPSEALIRGSSLPGAPLSRGAICVGCRLELWADEKVLLTSPIKSIEVKHGAPAESMRDIARALHSTSLHRLG